MRLITLDKKNQFRFD